MTPKAKRTKAKLLQAAKQLFKEKGYNDIPVEKITKTAEVAKGTFYHYFTKKEDIVLELAYKEIQERQAEVLESKKNTHEKICEYMKIVFEEADKMPEGLLRNWLQDSIKGKKINPDATKFSEKIQGFIRKLFTREISGKYKQEKIPIEKISEVLVTRIYGFITAWLIHDKEEKISEYAIPYVQWEVKQVLDSYKNESKN